jgi:hypothetical protein
MKAHRARVTPIMLASRIEGLDTADVLALHERFVGHLDDRTKHRMLATAREHGWDRTWNDAPVAH